MGEGSAVVSERIESPKTGFRRIYSSVRFLPESSTKKSPMVNDVDGQIEDGTSKGTSPRILQG
jgi:hypothetical protein